MDFWEQIFSVWRALAANKLRSFLTLLGVIMGVGTIVVLSSVMGGGLAAIKRSVQNASGDDVLKVSVKWRNDDGDRNPQLKTQDMEAMMRAAGLRKATIVPQVDATVPVGGVDAANESDVRVLGVNPDALSFYQLEVGQGRFLGPRDRAEAKRVAVLGRDVAERLFPKGAVGQEIHVAGERFRVIGVLSNKPSLNVGNRTWNKSVAVPDTTLLTLNGNREVNAILVKTNDTERLDVKLGLLDRTVEALLVNRNYDQKTLEIEHALKRSAGEAGFLTALRVLLYAVAAICMGVGGINIMNIMLVTVSERTREIGLRLAIGARAQDVKNQFLFEAAAISALGGILGVVSGLLLSWIVSLVLTQVLGYWPFLVDPLAIAIAFASALVVGVVFGWYPASRAAALQPIECLRYE